MILCTNYQKTADIQNLNALWVQWLEDKKAEGFDSRAYFITMTFDRYRNRYLARGGDNIAAPTRADVIGGLTTTMPKYDACLEYRGDVRRWYLRLLRHMFGGQYAKHYDRQPCAIGYFDEPVHKGQRADAAEQLQLLPGDQFPHVHMVMVVDGLPSNSGKSEVTWQAFERLYETGELQTIWQRWNLGGVVHVEPVFDIAGALDYASKSAKRDPLLEENQILLPFDQPDEVTVLN